MKYPKREINSEPFKNQLDIIERITIEIKHQSNNPIFKTNQRFTNNQNYNRYHHHHNNNNNNNKNKSMVVQIISIIIMEIFNLL